MSRSPRVLVVEDDAEIAGALRRSLRIEGYDVRVAEDGEEALSESGVFEPDAVVLDLGLPHSTASRSAAACATRATCRS